MTLLVRDEEDILEANLDFHRAMGVDLFLVTDNLSEDRTPEILEHYAREGLVIWRRETDDDYSQHRWVTRMAREAAVEHGADWVINNDADEFWIPRDGDLKTALAGVAADLGGIHVPRVEFLTRPDSPDPFWDRLTVRYADSIKPDGKKLLSKAAHRAHPEVDVAQGNHDVEAPGLGPLVADDRIEILHAPLRSFAQFANKIEKGGRAYDRNTELPPTMGRRWRTLYERHRDGTLPEWYDQQLLRGPDIDEGLVQGRFVIDHRLLDFFTANPPSDLVGLRTWADSRPVGVARSAGGGVRRLVGRRAR